MSYRLEKLITRLLDDKKYIIVDNILDYLDIEESGNCLNDLVDIVKLCKNSSQKLENLYWFKLRLSDKIIKERGKEAGKILIDRIYN